MSKILQVEDGSKVEVNTVSAAEADDDSAALERRARIGSEAESDRHIIAAEALRELGADDAFLIRQFGYVPARYKPRPKPNGSGYDPKGS